MLDLLNTIVQWIITGLNNVFNVIESIPRYINNIFYWINMLPQFMTIFITVAITGAIIIKIKRLII